MKQYITLLFTLLGLNLLAQSSTISGTVKDGENGEDLFEALIIVKELSNTGAKTNAYGFYSLTLPNGTYTLIVRAPGYDHKEIEVELTSNKRMDVELFVPSAVKEIQEVEITATKENDNITKSGMAVTTLTPKDIETIPVIFGEKDIVKTLQLTPGVKAAGEGNAGFYVRGGGADQNLVLIDEAPVYNASHLLGFFSVFNSDCSAFKPRNCVWYLSFILLYVSIPISLFNILSSAFSINSVVFLISASCGLLRSTTCGWLIFISTVV